MKVMAAIILSLTLKRLSPMKSRQLNSMVLLLVNRCIRMNHAGWQRDVLQAAHGE